MPRFTQADIVRSIKGFTDAGLKVASVKITPDGTIIVNVAGQEDALEPDDWQKGSPLYQPPEKEPNAYSVRTLAERWGCSEQLIRNMIKRGELRSFRYGSMIRITPEAVGQVEARRSAKPLERP